VLKIFRHHVPTWSLVELVADGALCLAAVLLAVSRMPDAALAPGRVPVPDVILRAAVLAACMALMYAFVGLYRQSAVQVGWRSLMGRALVALVVGSCIAYALFDSTEGDTLVLVGTAVPLMAVGAIAVRSVGYMARRSAVGTRRVLIVGTGAEAQSVAVELSADRGKQLTIVGFYPTHGESAPMLWLEGRMAPVFLDQTPIEELVRRHHVDEVIVAVREQRGGGLPMDQLLACRISGVPVLDLSAVFERAKGEVPIDSLKASWLVYGHGFVQGWFRTAIKRLFDVVMSVVLLTVAAPVMVLTALAIVLEGPGPIIYRQDRVGLRGRTFKCLKFRSMAVDAERDGVARWAQKNDARVTRVGAVIRKYRIDELPQLVSVLRGEMSLVGPRPERPEFVRRLQAEIPFYDIRHSVKPGVTGWAQVRYTYGASVDDARKKHQYDLYYVKNHSLFLDLLVLIETVSVVAFGEGAH